MCGACGTGGGLPRWEDRLEHASRRVLSSRASAANRLLAPGRFRVRTWGTGYVLNDGRGRSAPAADLDDLWRTCRHWGAQLTAWPAGGSTEEVGLDIGSVIAWGAVATWVAAVTQAADLSGALELQLPDHVRSRTLQLDLSPRTVRVTVLAPGAASASLSGPGAQSAAEHLLAALGA